MSHMTNDKMSQVTYNITTAFKITLARLLQLNEITYIFARLKNITFINIYINWSNILFIKDNKYTLLRFKYSKINI